jgi:hypothetical protein
LTSLLLLEVVAVLLTIVRLEVVVVAVVVGIGLPQELLGGEHLRNRNYL